jgi:hypothetical protein
LTDYVLPVSQTNDGYVKATFAKFSKTLANEVQTKEAEESKMAIDISTTCATGFHPPLPWSESPLAVHIRQSV